METIAPPSPASFYENYVLIRKPVKFSVFPPLPSSISSSTATQPLQEQWSNSKLSALIGPDTLFQVEQKVSSSSSATAYGQGGSTWMKFGEFLSSSITSNTRSLYLTTQPLNKSDYSSPDGSSSTSSTSSNDDEPLIIPPNLQPLFSSNSNSNSNSNSIPLRLPLFHNLIPLTTNIWFGGASSQSSMTSSGLHHDYHDNVYLLLRGRKHITLYPPTDNNISSLYPHGALQATAKTVKVYENGRVVYPCQVDETGGEIRADGALVNVERWYKAKIRMEELERDDEADEDEIDEVLEELLEAERGLEGGKDEFEGDFDDDDDDDDEEEEEEEGVTEAEKESYRGLLEIDDNASNKKRKLNKSYPTPSTKPTTPPNFSQITDTANPTSAYNKENFPNFVNATGKIEVEIVAGEGVYIPAGWWHEVRSGAVEEDKGGEYGGHLALNYWVHPPDKLGEGGDYERPYNSGFWEWDWKRRGYE